MEKKTVTLLVTASTALEGSTLDYRQNTLLLEKGVSSEGKTIAEQLMNIDLASAYEEAARIAERGDMLNVFRIRNLANCALKHSGASYKGNDAILSRVCAEVNETLMHLPSSDRTAVCRASYLAHFRISAGKPWTSGNDLMARLVMNLVQMRAGLEPEVVPAELAHDYKRILDAAVREDISDIFTDHAGTALRPVSSLSGISRRQEAAPANAAAGHTDNKQRILELLAAHPRMTTAGLAGELGISSKGVEKHLSQLKASGRLRRVGPDKGGHWAV